MTTGEWQAMLALPQQGRVLGFQAAIDVALDLEHAQQALALAESLTQDEADDHRAPADAQQMVVLRSLWVAAVISYAVCFSGRRGALQRAHVEALDAESLPGALEVHDALDGMRNRHVAHRDSELRQVVAAALPADSGIDPPGAAQVGHLVGDLVVPHPESFTHARLLVEALLVRQEQRIRTLAEQVKDDLASMPASEWAQLPTARVVVADLVDSTERRPGRRR